MAQRKRIGIFTIAATYVGTVVGAGFATGQEVLRFFTHHGVGGIYGVLGATVLFAILGALVLKLGHDVQAESHRPIVEAAVGPMLGRLLDWVIIFFLFGGAAVMMVGSGALFEEHWHLNRFLGTVIMALLAGVTVMAGLRGVLASISAVAPLLITLVLVVSVGVLMTVGIAPSDLAWRQPAEAASPFWFISLLLYVSYNLILSISVLGPLGKEVDEPRTLYWGGMIGGAALGLGALFIHLALMAGLPESAGFEVPLLHLARRFPPWLYVLYSIILWAEVYTTAVASLYGLAVRFAKPGSARFRWLVPGATLGALLASQLGFGSLVGTLYPAVGWIGLVLVGGLLLKLFNARRSSQGG